MDDEILQEFLAESWENLGRLDNEIVQLEQHPDQVERLAEIFRTIHTIKGTCGFIGLERLGQVAHSTENVLGRMRDGTLAATPEAISRVLEGIDRIKEFLVGLEATGSEPDIPTEDLQKQLDRLAEMPSPADPPASQTTANVPATADADIAEAVDDEPVTGAARDSGIPAGAIAAAEHGEPAARAADLSIRVHVDVLDHLMNLVGELVLARNQLLQVARSESESVYAAPIAHLNRITSDLQEGVMKTRMQPIGQVWSKLPRLVRDLTQLTGKQIELEMVGAETELDRTVLEAIKDPLTHMVRNSADHGIESAAERQAAGKPATGRIKLHACHEGGQVVIRLEDDGRGIDAAKVLRKGIERGLVDESQAAQMPESEILSLIFRPGFSTSEQVTSISGRGVGMDVVKTAIERIGGTVDLSSTAGKGTSVRIRIPLTLAIISALVVRSGRESFAIPQLGVVELVRLSADSPRRIERIHDTEVLRLRDRLLPLVHLRRLLELDEQTAAASDHTPTETEEETNIVVVQIGDEQCGLIVDEVFDTEEIVVKPVGRLLQGLGIYQGTTILGDGRVIMILDVNGIAERSGELTNPQTQAACRSAQDAAAAQETTRLLLLDVGQSSPLAVPLSLVARLEELDRRKIETAGDRFVTQYRGQLLPLVPATSTWRLEDGPDPQPVVVFSERNNALGLMVDRICDIVEEPLDFHLGSERPGLLGSTVIRGVATDIIDIQHYLRQVNPRWFQQRRKDARRRVLIVDESAFFREVAKSALERHGMSVIGAGSVADALAILDSGRPIDVIVSDLEFQHSSGARLAEHVSDSARSPRPRMIALSSADPRRAASAATEAGFDRFLVKFDAAELQRTIEELAPAPATLQGATA